LNLGRRGKEWIVKRKKIAREKEWERKGRKGREKRFAMR
jgi:hypothetical protein